MDTETKCNIPVTSGKVTRGKVTSGKVTSGKKAVAIRGVMHLLP